MKNYWLHIIFFSLFPFVLNAQSDTVNQTDVNGLKQGIWLEHYKNGQLKKRTNFIDGLPQGGETGYYKDGQVKYTIIWKDSVPNGFYQIYYMSGSIKETGVWRNNHNVGDQVEYYETGTVRSRTSHSSNGDLEGAQIYYFQNEIIMKVVMYEDNLRNGFSIDFDSLGSLIGYEKYANDLLIKNPPESDELRGILAYVTDQNQLIFTRDSLRIEEIQSKEQIAKQGEQLKAEETRRLYLYIGLGFLLVFGLFMYNRFRVTRRQKKTIEEQKNEVAAQKEIIEESHREITDSIAYAKRIQSAILPPAEMVKAALPNSFILYRPKDIVAGDFYWVEQFDGKTYFAAADCTGHGVPGAMVSVICNSALNRALREFKLTEPAQILDKARQLVIQEFKKSEQDVKDGMDIALCCINGNQLKYAGAHNPLWIVRNGEVLETKADKQPIGKYVHAEPFTNNTVPLEAGDTIYVFSDGYPDQFGGEKGKKLKSRNFKEILIGLQDLPMADQENKLNEAFDNWRGSLEQIDDVCVIGVRI